MSRAILLLILIIPSLLAASTPLNFRYWNKSRGYNPFTHATPDGIRIDNKSPSPTADAFDFDIPHQSFTLSFRASNLNGHPSGRFSHKSTDGTTVYRKKPEWQFFIVQNHVDTMWFTVRQVENPDAFSSTAALVVDYSFRTHIPVIEFTSVSENIDCYSGLNIWKIDISPQSIEISVGNSSLRPVMRLPGNGNKFTAFGFAASPAAHLLVSDIILSTPAPPYAETTSWSDPNHLDNYLRASSDPMEGYWVIFDRALEESLLMMGGDYRLAIVRDADRYLIIYLSGARVNPQKWKPGMVKGILTPDPFPGIYSLQWFDADGLPLSHDIKAQRGDGATLNIQFPYQSSALRLRRIASNL